MPICSTSIHALPGATTTGSCDNSSSQLGNKQPPLCSTSPETATSPAKETIKPLNRLSAELKLTCKNSGSTARAGTRERQDQQLNLRSPNPLCCTLASMVHIMQDRKRYQRRGAGALWTRPGPYHCIRSGGRLPQASELRVWHHAAGRSAVPPPAGADACNDTAL